jgi:hypothetical protein
MVGFPPETDTPELVVDITVSRSTAAGLAALQPMP